MHIHTGRQNINLKFFEEIKSSFNFSILFSTTAIEKKIKPTDYALDKLFLI